MNFYLVVTLFSTVAIIMIFCGGAIFVIGSETAGLALTGLGAGWLGILFGVLMRAASRNPGL